MANPSRHVVVLVAAWCLMGLGCQSSDSGQQPPPITPSESSLGQESSGVWQPSESVTAPIHATPSTPPSGEWRPTNQETPVLELQLSDEHFRGVAGPLLPRPEALDQWSYLYPPTYYSSSTLFELINGGADSYLDHGFEQAANAVLRLNIPPSTVGREVTLEITIFSMANVTAAENKFDEDHSDGPCDTHEALQNRHCSTSSSLDMLIGSYYVRLLLDCDDPSLGGRLLSMANLIRETHRAWLEGPDQTESE